MLGTSPDGGRSEAEALLRRQPGRGYWRLTPRPPMCRPYIDTLGGFCFDPPAQDTPAGEPEGVRPIVVDDG